MDQWKREAIRMLQETEFGKTTVRFDKYKNPYTTNRCFECNGLGYHKTGCKLKEIISSPADLNRFLMELYKTFGSKRFTIEQAEKKLKIPIDKLREKLNELLDYSYVHRLNTSKKEIYDVTCEIKSMDDVIKEVEDVHGTD